MQYIQKPAIHHFYRHHSAQSYQQPSPGFLQEPLNCSPGFHPCPFHLLHDSGQSDLVKMIVRSCHSSSPLPPSPPTLLQPQRDPCWSLTTFHELPPPASVLADSPPWSTLPQIYARLTLGLYFCSNVTFSVRLFSDHSIQKNNFILQSHPTHIPCSFFPGLFFSIFLVYFVVCLHQLECNLHEVRNFCLFYAVLYPQCLKQCMIHSKCPINICSMNE